MRLLYCSPVPTFRCGEIDLRYDEVAGEGVPVVLLHGLSSARTTWHRLVPALGGRRVLALDQRGHNESDHAPGTYDLGHYTADAIAFCEQIVGEPSVLVGHSLGGVVAFVVARTRPNLTRAVLLEDPPLYRGDSTEPDGAPSGVAAFFPAMRQMLRDMHQRDAPLEDYVATLRNVPAMNGQGSLADVLGEEGTLGYAHAWRGLDPEVFTPAIEGGAISGAHGDTPLTVPCVVVRADPNLGAAFDEDDAARFARVNPAARIVVAVGASHAVHDEQPDLVRDELRRLLAEIDG